MAQIDFRKKINWHRRYRSPQGVKTEHEILLLMILNLMTLTIAVRLVRKKSAMRNRKSKKKLTNPKMKPWMKSA